VAGVDDVGTASAALDNLLELKRQAAVALDCGLSATRACGVA